MEQLVSPDIPAISCYYLVLLVGMFVAATSINTLLKDVPDHWKFSWTWVLFIAHSLVPVLLFWFLDYTGALRDTSLFGALVVAFGYQQVFSGGVKGIQMPGQTSLLWQPFQAWVNKVAQQVAARNRLSLEKRREGLRKFLRKNPDRITELSKLVFVYTKDPARVKKELEEAAALPVPPGATQAQAHEIAGERIVRKLIDELYLSVPEKRSVIFRFRRKLPPTKPAFWIGHPREWLIPIFVVPAIGVLFVASVVFFARSPALRAKYYQWRLLKADASDRDQSRTIEYFRKQLLILSTNFTISTNLTRSTNAAVSANITLTTNTAIKTADLERFYGPALKRLRYRVVPLKQVDGLEKFIFNTRFPKADDYIIPELIYTLQTDNLDVRMRIQRLLTEIQTASYATTNKDIKVPEWQPKKEDALHVVAGHQDEWRKWWAEARKSPRPD